ncbi:dihydroorotate dehydrogenase [Bacillus sp. NTK071]|uniref:dihydroorotate dehydrogenase n=1 Tax=Bacillus sp. NTK071 TaxID=2802175 RepID=UPI001A8CAB9E|nr:dihydroorotate dehydrogenase [Bacillus sp. NTK071]MBN8207539.1 dihydroorotate dehydrogenase [Bacillus sp. NTK071]
MPDWSYHVLFKPFLSRWNTEVSREFIHQSMNRIASLPGGHHLIHFLGREEVSEELTVKIENLSFPGCVGLSDKIDPRLSGLKGFSHLGFSCIEIGPITKEPSEKYLKPIRVQNGAIFLPERGEKVGLTKTIQRLDQVKLTQPFLFNISGTNNEIIEIARALRPYNGVYEIHYDQIDFSNLSILKLIGEWKCIFVRVPSRKIESANLHQIHPYITGIVLDEDLSLDTNENLTIHKQAIEYCKKVHPSLRLVTVGGVKEPVDALGFLNNGADLLLLSGEYVEVGPGLTKRIYEAILDTDDHKEESNGWKDYFLFGFFVMIGGIIALVLSLTSIVLPYDESFMQLSREELLLFNERLLWFMAHDRMTLAGTMISGGVVYMTLSINGVKYGLLWAKQAIDIAAIIGFLGILLFIGYGYFDWLHLLFWIVLLPFYLRGYVKSKEIKGTPKSLNRHNDLAWRRGVLGQFCFVMLGFSFVLGGVIIAGIGVTGVFVPTDLQYICMPADAIQSFNDRLISVIAHDRAGFGSAMISVGLLVLMSALWGFQAGNNWLWWMFLLGGIPAFVSGIFVHIMIGYTTFIHLLPAYIALGLFLGGLYFSHSYLMQKKA